MGNSQPKYPAGSVRQVSFHTNSSNINKQPFNKCHAKSTYSPFMDWPAAKQCVVIGKKHDTRILVLPLGKSKV